MNQRYVDQDGSDDDRADDRSPTPDSSTSLERTEAALPAAIGSSPPDRSLDRELAARLDQIRRPAPGAVGFAEWVAGEQTLATARSAYAAGDLAAAGERLERAERSFVRSGSPVDAVAVGLERAALAALGRDTGTLAEIARLAEYRLLTDLPVGLRAALQMLIRAIQTDRATPGLTSVLAEYAHMVRTGTTAATRFDRPERPIPLRQVIEPPAIERLPEEGLGKGSPE